MIISNFLFNWFPSESQGLWTSQLCMLWNGIQTGCALCCLRREAQWSRLANFSYFIKQTRVSVCISSMPELSRLLRRKSKRRKAHTLVPWKTRNQFCEELSCGIACPCWTGECIGRRHKRSNCGERHKKQRKLENWERLFVLQE